MARTTDKLKNFEANYEKLEEVVKALDAPDLTLKDSLDLYEKAIKLSEACESALEYAKQRAQALAEIHERADEDDSSDQTLEEGTLGL